MMFWSYFKAEFKNCIILIKKTIIAYLLIFTALTAVFAAVSIAIGDSSVKKIKTAVVSNDNDELNKLLLQYISQIDSVKEVTEFVYLNEPEAFNGLDRGDVNVVVILPEGFYDDVNNGTNTPLNIYINEDSDSVTKAFVNILKSATSYVQITEASVYSFLDIKRSGEYELRPLEQSVGDHMAMSYATLLLHRMRLFVTEIVSQYEDVEPLRFYFCSFFIIFLLYSSMSYGALYDRNSVSAEKLLDVYSLSRLKISLCKEFVISFGIYISSLIVIFITILIQNVTGLTMIEPSASMFFVTWFIGFVVACGVDLIYSVMGSDSGVMTGVFIIIAVLIICSGMIIPSALLSKTAVFVGSVSPLRYMFKTLLLAAVSGSFTVELIFLLVFVLGFNVVSLICKRS